MSAEQPSSSVSATARQDEEVQRHLRWCWTEPAVWTERMLTALDEGVKGGKWFRLIDKVFAERTLRASYGKVAANGGAPGVDHVTVEAFGNLYTMCAYLSGMAAHEVAPEMLEYHDPGYPIISIASATKAKVA